MGIKTFEIFFDDLKPEVQKELLKTFNTTVEDENWDSFPITELVREDEE